MRYRIQLEPTDPVIAASFRRQGDLKEEYTEAASPEQARRFIRRRYPGCEVKAIIPDPRGTNPSEERMLGGEKMSEGIKEKIQIECSCVNETARWLIQGVLNTSGLLAESNLKRAKEAIERTKGLPPAFGPGYEEMAYYKLMGDLEAIEALKVALAEIPICKTA